MKTMITTGRKCGAAEWINYPHFLLICFFSPFSRVSPTLTPAKVEKKTETHFDSTTFFRGVGLTGEIADLCKKNFMKSFFLGP